MSCRECEHQRLTITKDHFSRYCMKNEKIISDEGLESCVFFEFKSTKGTIIQAHKNSRKLGIGSKKYKTLYKER